MSSDERYYLRLFFDLVDIFAGNSHAIYKVLYPEGMEFLDFKIVLAKSLIGTYNSIIAGVKILEGLKIKHTFNAIHVGGSFFVLDFWQ